MLIVPLAEKEGSRRCDGRIGAAVEAGRSFRSRCVCCCLRRLFRATVLGADAAHARACYGAAALPCASFFFFRPSLPLPLFLF